MGDTKNLHSDVSASENTHSTPGDVMTLHALQQQEGHQRSSIPQCSVSTEINASTMLAKINQSDEEDRPSFTGLLLQGTGKILHKFPLVNGTFIADDQIKLHSDVHIAIAVDTSSGVTFPVISNVTQHTNAALHHTLEQLSEKAENAQLAPEELEGATFTVINLGMFEVFECQANVFPPQLATLAVGAIAYRLVMTGNRIINIPFFTATLTCDARVIDAVTAAKFLQKLKEVLEE